MSNPKVFPLNGVKATLPVFGASTSETYAPDEYNPKEPLRWWYRTDQSSHWCLVPDEALEELEPHRKSVVLHKQRLNVARGSQVFINVSDSAAPPTEPTTVCIAVPESGTHGERGGGGRGDPTITVVGTGTTRPKAEKFGAISLERSFVPNTSDEILWVVIRNSTSDLGFNHYKMIMDSVFGICRSELRSDSKFGGFKKDWLERFTISDVEAYKVLKEATAHFVMRRCGIVGDREIDPKVDDEEARLGHGLGKNLDTLWREYLLEKGTTVTEKEIEREKRDEKEDDILPYLYLIRQKMGCCPARQDLDHMNAFLRWKLTHPCLLELIWAYWMEEAMLVQTFNSITRRFQNLETQRDRDPLGQLETNPLLPLNNFLWGWVQEEMDHLTVRRRAHEYEHEYGFTLQGRALGKLRSADRRSKFLESFHNLLWKCTQFYRQDDDTTVKADGFQVLNAIKETHYVLSHGAHNQYGNLPSTARQEMLMQQWILSLPEMREFLGTRAMVPYPEAWMDRVDSVKTLKGWTNTSVVHFRDLAVFGEQVLLSVRWDNWSECDDPNRAANWARYWRAEVQGYVHAYRAATGVDLTADVTDPRLAQGRFLPPSVHLRNRLADQASR